MIVKDQDIVHDKAMVEYAIKRGIENMDDRVLLNKEIYPSLAKKPHYKGDGMHSCAELQEICKQYADYCHQQALIKQKLLQRMGWTD